MSDKLQILLIDDVNDYISYPVLRADDLDLLHIDTWTTAQHLLNTQTELIDPDIILIDINFQADQSAPRWKDSEVDYGDKKPTGLFIGLAFSGLLYRSGMPRIGSIYSADPSLFRDDPATRTAAALLDMAVNRPSKLWSKVSIDDWFDNFNLGSDPHHACKIAIIKLREKIIIWCQDDLEKRLTVTPKSYWQVATNLKQITNIAELSKLKNKLSLEFVTCFGVKRKLNLCSLFAECDLSNFVSLATKFLQKINYLPTLLKECLEYAEQINEGSRLTVIIPETKPLERLVVLLILLLNWWQQRPEIWRTELNYSWDLDNACPSVKPSPSLKIYLKRLANALCDFTNIDITDLSVTAQEIEVYLSAKSSQLAIFNKKVVIELLPMLFKAGVLRKTANNKWKVLEQKIEREQKIDCWQPDISGIKFLQQDFLDSLQMQTNQFQRIIQEANKIFNFSLPIYWENYWKGNGQFQLPIFFRVMLQDYVKEYLLWNKESEWPTWLLDKIT